MKAERRRTVSMRKISEAREELLRRSQTPDIKEVCISMSKDISVINPNLKITLINFIQTIPPYDPLEFPLSTDTIDEMIKLMPNDYKELIDNCISMAVDDSAAAIKALEAQPIQSNDLHLTDRFPHLMMEGDSDETESAMSGALEEDPNDPEWCETKQS